MMQRKFLENPVSYTHLDVYKRQDMDSEKEKAILTYRYLREYDWDDIARKTGYCLQWVHKIHARALAHFKIPKEAIESDT